MLSISAKQEMDQPRGGYLSSDPLPSAATKAGGAEVTRLESAALRLYAATKADRERSAKMARLVCEREGNFKDYDRPCWKAWHNPGHIEDGPEACWEYPSGEYGEHPSSWCEPCQQRQKLYDDKSVRQELGKAKNAFWAACRAAEREVRK